jgi:hypothetical protein
MTVLFQAVENFRPLLLPGRVLRTILGVDCVSHVALVQNVAYLI